MYATMSVQLLSMRLYLSLSVLVYMTVYNEYYYWPIAFVIVRVNLVVFLQCCYPPVPIINCALNCAHTTDCG